MRESSSGIIERRKVIINGSWEEISKSAIATKKGIIDTSSGFDDLENLAISNYLIPNQGYEFSRYKSRIVQSLAQRGMKEDIASLLHKNEVVLSFYLIENEEGNILKIDSVTGENKYSITISSDPDYCGRAARIASKIKETLIENTIWYSYIVTDRPVF